MPRLPMFPLLWQRVSRLYREQQNQQPEWTLFHPPFHIEKLDWRCIAEMFDDTIQKRQCIAKFYARHLSRRRGMHGLVQFDETLLYMAQYGGKYFAGNSAVRVTRSKFNERSDDCQAAQTTKFVGIEQHTSL